jgi:hypothetical protein
LLIPFHYPFSDVLVRNIGWNQHTLATLPAMIRLASLPLTAVYKGGPGFHYAASRHIPRATPGPSTGTPLADSGGVKRRLSHQPRFVNHYPISSGFLKFVRAGARHFFLRMSAKIT